MAQIDVSKTVNIGRMLYPEDVISVDLNNSISATPSISVDSRFTVTLAGYPSVSGVHVYASNSNSHIRNAVGTLVADTTFSSTFVDLGVFNANGYFIGDGYFRYIKIVNSSGNFSTSAKAYIFAEKIVPTIY